MIIRICIANKEDAEGVQLIFNHRDIIGLLGGFVHLKSIQDAIKPVTGAVSVWYAMDIEKAAIVGATMLGGRPQSHLAKYGMVGVLPGYQRQGIGRALYFAMTVQGILEGRRLFEDTIVGDNPTQFQVLPRLGLSQAGELRHRTGSAKSIFLFQLSLLDPNATKKLTPKEGIVVEVRDNHYSREVYQKNMELYRKHSPTLFTAFSGVLASVHTSAAVRVQVDTADPTKERRAAFQRKSLVEDE